MGRQSSDLRYLLIQSRDSMIDQFEIQSCARFWEVIGNTVDCCRQVVEQRSGHSIVHRPMPLIISRISFHRLGHKTPPREIPDSIHTLQAHISPLLALGISCGYYRLHVIPSWLVLSSWYVPVRCKLLRSEWSNFRSILCRSHQGKYTVANFV